MQYSVAWAFSTKVPAGDYPFSVAARTAATTFAGDGFIPQVLPATFWPATQTVNSPRSPSTSEASMPSVSLSEAAARAA